MPTEKMRNDSWRHATSTISDQLHTQLRKAVIQGEIAPGESISEAQISKMFAVSRQVVRTAFIKLTEERWMDISPQRGTRVRKISVREVLDARFVREVVEISIVRELATMSDRAWLGGLREIVAQQKTVVTDAVRFMELDVEFHRMMALATRREYAWQIVEVVKAQMDRVRHLSAGRIPDDTQELIPDTQALATEHDAILDAIESRDADLAERLMRRHLKEIEVFLPALAENQPERFTA